MLPIWVLLDSKVPLFKVQNSLTVVLSPIMRSVFSPLNFKSCGISPITALWKIRQFEPIFENSFIVACENMVVPLPIITSFSITANGPIVTFSPIWADESITAVGWIWVEILASFIYYRCHHFCKCYNFTIYGSCSRNFASSHTKFE